MTRTCGTAIKANFAIIQRRKKTQIYPPFTEWSVINIRWQHCGGVDFVMTTTTSGGGTFHSTDSRVITATGQTHALYGLFAAKVVRF